MSLQEVPDLKEHPYNALDVLGASLNACKDAKEAIKQTINFENGIEEAKGNRIEPNRTVIDPELINHEQLIKDIKEEMER